MKREGRLHLAHVRCRDLSGQHRLDRRPFQTAALLFTLLDDSYEAAHEWVAKSLGMIFNRDFRDVAAKYCLLEKPDDCLDQMRQFARAGCRHFVISALSDPAEIIERASTSMVSELRSLVD
jgi:hypothetical protein